MDHKIQIMSTIKNGAQKRAKFRQKKNKQNFAKFRTQKKNTTN